MSDCPACKDKELKEDEINELADAVTGLKLLQKHGIDRKGVKSVEDAQTKLRIHLMKVISVFNEQKGAQTPITAKVQINSGSIRELILAQRDGCRTLYSEAVKLGDFVDKLPQGKIIKDLKTAIPDTDERLQRAKTSLDSDEFSLLIAGDTGSGKSSFLNLLLGEHVSDLLPVAHTSSTSAICEIRYGPEVALQVKAVGSQDFRNVDLSIRDKQHVAKKLAELAHQREKRDEGFAYEIVRVYLPVEWLRHNITIVDSPGIGENEKLTQLVKEYIPKASGFIYVINPTIDGGFTPDKMQDLLFAHLDKERRQNEEQAFDPLSAIFVCNKWDDIRKNEKEDIMDHIKTNLMKIWPEFSEDQLFFFSTKQTVASLKDNFVPDEYKKLLAGLERLLPIACRNRLTKQYWSLREVISRANFTLRLFLMRKNSDEQAVDDRCSKILGDLDTMEQNQAKVIEDMQNMAEREVDSSLMKLRDYLLSSEVSDELLRWSESECPEAPRNVDQLDIVLKHAASRRIVNEIIAWEKKNKIFEGIAKVTHDNFEAQFYKLRAELDFIENYKLSAGKIEIKYDPALVECKQLGLAQAHGESNKGMKTYKKIIVGVTAPVWAPLSLALGLIALPVFGTIAYFKNKEVKKKLNAYNDNKSSAMRHVTRDLLSTFMDSSEIQRLFSDNIQELQRSVKNMLEQLPNIIKANRELAKDALESATSATKRLKESCGEIYETGVDLENAINTIYLNQIKTYDIDIEDLEPWCWKTVGKGSSAVVFEATYNGQKVAVKKAVNRASGYDSTDFILEETNFRKLKLPNIVEFLGTSVQRVGTDVYPILVLEHCYCSLDKIVLDANKYYAPGCIADQIEREASEAYALAALYCYHISTALMSLHNIGYVHRDLKLENILVADDGQVKLTDLGLSKPAAFITGTLLGTPLYMAPEVWEEKVYHHSADIFSLGLIIWELWYGTSVVQKYQVSNLEEFRSNPFVGNAPPEEWQDTIVGCIHLDPDERPRANEMSDFFCGVYHKSRHQDI